MTAHGFSREGARRVVDATRAVEGADLLVGGRRRRGAMQSSPQAFITARVTEQVNADATELKAVEQFWDSDAGEFADIPGGRTWDGESENLPTVVAIDGRPRDVGDRVTLGLRHGANGVGQWYIVPEKFLVPVDVTATGNDGVYNDSEPDWTYDVYTKSGKLLASALTPEISFRDKTPTTAATTGAAYLDDGDWRLLVVGEKPDHSRGYYQLEGTDGSTASEVTNPDGKIQFGLVSSSAGTGTQVPVHVVVSNDGAGTDTLQAYFYDDDYPGGGGGADGHGYETVTDGTTSLNVTDGGIIEFDTATPSSNELAVEFTVADNDPTATVTAIVDTSSLDTPTVSGGAFIIDWEHEVESTGGTEIVTIDGRNFSGRAGTIAFFESAGDQTRAQWDEQSNSQTTNPLNWKCGASESTDVVLDTGTYFKIFIDVSDGYKLKIEVLTTPSTNSRFGRWVIKAGPRKTSADHTS